MEISVKRLATILAVGVLALGAMPAHAFHNDGLPLVEAHNGIGAGWRSITVTTDGSEYALDVISPNVSKAGQGGGFFYSTDNTLLGGFAFTGFPGKSGALVSIPVANVDVDTETSPAGGLFGLGFTFNGPRSTPFVGTWKILTWWASEGATWDWSFRSAGGTTIDAAESGPGAYLTTTRDFTSVAQAEGHQLGIGARASVGADHALGVSNTLVGFYQMGATAIGTMSVTTPKGEQNCSVSPVVVPFTGGICSFVEMKGAKRNGAGTYTFHTTSAGAVFSGAFDDVWFGGADARLPA